MSNVFPICLQSPKYEMVVLDIRLFRFFCRFCRKSQQVSQANSQALSNCHSAGQGQAMVEEFEEPEQMLKWIYSVDQPCIYLCIFHVCLVYDCFRPWHFEGAQSLHNARSVNCEVALPKSDALLPLMANISRFDMFIHVPFVSVCSQPKQVVQSLAKYM